MKIFDVLSMKRAIILMAPFILMACEKSNEGLGFEQVIGGSPELGKLEFPVVTYTVPIDSQLVALSYNDQFLLGGYQGNRLLGSYIDPYFGKASASIVTQIAPQDLDVNFGVNPKIDSVQLFLRYAGHYGDTSTPMDLAVYQLGQELSRDSLFYSSYRPALGDKIGEKLNFKPRPNSLAVVNGLLTNPTLSIPIDSSFIRRTIVDKGDGTFDGFSTTLKFYEYFKGLYITATSDDGSILYFDLTASNSRMVIYYGNEEQDSLSYSYIFSQQITEKPITFSVFDHQFTAPTEAAFDPFNPDTINGDDRLYVQAMGGTAGILRIPGIDTLAESGLLVNEAFITLEKSTGVGTGLSLPSRMELREYDGQPTAVIPDFGTQNSGLGDGIYQSEPLRQGRYRFEVTRHIFNVLNGAPAKPLAVVPVTKTSNARRAILEGGTSDSHPVTLTVYYTKTEN